MFSCPECNKNFTTKFNRTRHLKNIHKIDLEEDDREIRRPERQQNKKRKMEKTEVEMSPVDQTEVETGAAVKKSIKNRENKPRRRELWQFY
uniref:C2H2-type domain-containing protein n=1 Tax=Meloidogyne javanica TaxID=6303 RepID=A0A915M8P1_MELJA